MLKPKLHLDSHVCAFKKSIIDAIGFNTMIPEAWLMATGLKVSTFARGAGATANIDQPLSILAGILFSMVQQAHVFEMHANCLKKCAV
jgi:hypothetical protein